MASQFHPASPPWDHRLLSHRSMKLRATRELLMHLTAKNGALASNCCNKRGLDLYKSWAVISQRSQWKSHWIVCSKSFYLGFQIPMQHPLVVDVFGTWAHLGKPFQDLKEGGGGWGVRAEKAKVWIPLKRLLTYQKCLGGKVSWQMAAFVILFVLQRPGRNASSFADGSSEVGRLRRRTPWQCTDGRQLRGDKRRRRTTDDDSCLTTCCFYMFRPQ